MLACLLLSNWNSCISLENGNWNIHVDVDIVVVDVTGLRQTNAVGFNEPLHGELCACAKDELNKASLPKRKRLALTLPAQDIERIDERASNANEAEGKIRNLCQQM